MEKQFIKATRAQLIASLKACDISRRTDKTDTYQEWNYVLLDDAAKAAKEEPRYRRPRSTICCRVYVTNKSGMYGYQFLAAVWVVIDGQHYQASGPLTGGCGYDKISTAVDDALRALGLDSKAVDHFGGTGQHEDVLDELMDVLAGRKAWIKV